MSSTPLDFSKLRPEWEGVETYARGLEVTIKRFRIGAATFERRSTDSENGQHILVTEARVLRRLRDASCSIPGREPRERRSWAGVELALSQPLGSEGEARHPVVYQVPVPGEHAVWGGRTCGALLDGIRRVLVGLDLLHELGFCLADGLSQATVLNAPTGLLFRRLGRIARFNEEGALHDFTTATSLLAGLSGLPGANNRGWEFPEAGRPGRTRLKAPPGSVAEAERALLFAAFDALASIVFEAPEPGAIARRGVYAAQRALRILLELRRSHTSERHPELVAAIQAIAVSDFPESALATVPIAESGGGETAWGGVAWKWESVTKAQVRRAADAAWKDGMVETRRE